MKIQGAVLHQPSRRIRIATVDLAEPKHNELLVKIAACGAPFAWQAAAPRQSELVARQPAGGRGAGSPGPAGPVGGADRGGGAGRRGG